MESVATAPLLGMRKLLHTTAEDLLEIIMRRYERFSTLLTSNRTDAPPAVFQYSQESAVGDFVAQTDLLQRDHNVGLGLRSTHCHDDWDISGA